MALNCSSVTLTFRPEAAIAASNAALSQGLPLGVIGTLSVVATGAPGAAAAAGGGAWVVAAGAALLASAGIAASEAAPAIKPRRLIFSLN
ncbi:hypothetical protein GCM10010909_23420 [Acidocella aquatica]|uniref:Uncharacterized protein n=1 Tax=Acidocella aquatica TaxID=1922313 RepID=A0ABQ6A726_9PROT|nr:hypothetical protein GCM10010909_23420 [Acidocella aquatica]